MLERLVITFFRFVKRKKVRPLHAYVGGIQSTGRVTWNLKKEISQCYRVQRNLVLSCYWNCILCSSLYAIVFVSNPIECYRRHYKYRYIFEKLTYRKCENRLIFQTRYRLILKYIIMSNSMTILTLSLKKKNNNKHFYHKRLLCMRRGNIWKSKIKPYVHDANSRMRRLFVKIVTLMYRRGRRETR